MERMRVVVAEDGAQVLIVPFAFQLGRLGPQFPHLLHGDNLPTPVLLTYSK